MSILTEIKNFACEILGIEKLPEVKSAEKKSPELIIKCENVESPEDKLEIKNNQPSEASKANTGAMKENIELKCTKYGFDGKELLKRGLLERVAGIAKEEFSKLSEEEKNKILGCIDFTLAKFQEYKKNNQISKDASVEELITETAKIYYNALKSGEFRNLQEFETAKGNINQELGDNFKNLDRIAQRAVLAKVRKNDEAKLKTELEAIKDLPEEQRAEAEMHIKRRHRHIQQGRFIDVVNVNASETAIEALIILPSSDLQYGAATVLMTRCDATERVRTADLADYSFFKALAENYNNVGDALSAEVVAGYTAHMMAEKSPEAAAQYQMEFSNDLKSYEEKIKNGEEVPEYLKAVMKGCKDGIKQVSTVIDSETEQTKSEKHTEKSDIEPIILQDSTVVMAAAKEEIQNDEPALANEDDIKPVISEKEKGHTKKEKKAALLVSNPIVIAKVIKEKGLNQAIKEYSANNIIETILDDGNLRHLRSRLATIIKSSDINSLIKISDTCSDSSFVFICSVVNPDKVKILEENRGHLCYTARKEVERIKCKNNYYANV